MSSGHDVLGDGHGQIAPSSDPIPGLIAGLTRIAEALEKIAKLLGAQVVAQRVVAKKGRR